MLSRRSFLQGLAVVAGSLALDPFRHVVTDGRQYRNLRLGLSATLPPGWDFCSIADFASLREDTKLLDELEDELHPLKDPDNLPVFLFEQPSDREGEVDAGALLYDEPLEGPAPADEPAGHAVMLKGFGMSYKDLVVIDPPELITVTGAPATISTFSYTHEVGKQRKELLVRTIVVFRGDRVHTFHLVDSLTSPVVGLAVWKQFIGSIHYSRPSPVA
jgi:hypothetical protein